MCHLNVFILFTAFDEVVVQLWWLCYLLNVLNCKKNETMSQIPGEKWRKILFYFMCTHPKPWAKWILFSYRKSAAHSTHLHSFSMGAGLPRTGMGPTAELIKEHQDTSPSASTPQSLIQREFPWATLSIIIQHNPSRASGSKRLNYWMLEVFDL